MLIAALLLSFQTAPAPVCTAMDANLPASPSQWATPRHGDPGDLTRPVVLVSRTAEDMARLDAMPKKPLSADELGTIIAQRPAPAQTGGMTRIGFRIDTAGTYGIALDQAGWIDVAPKGGAALKSVKHGHGPECSTIRKIVRFDLRPGAYTLTLTKLVKPQAKVMLVKD